MNLYIYIVEYILNDNSQTIMVDNEKRDNLANARRKVEKCYLISSYFSFELYILLVEKIS